MRNDIKTVSLDIDGTLGEFLLAAFDHIYEKTGHRYTFADVTGWRVEEYMAPEHAKLFDEFMMDPESYHKPQAIRGASEVVHALYDATDAEGNRLYRIVVASHRPPEAKEVTAQWLEANGIPHDELLVHWASKIECLERHGAVGPILFLDDDPKMVSKLGLPKDGHQIALIQSPILKEVPDGIPVFSDWEAIGQHMGVGLAGAAL